MPYSNSIMFYSGNKTFSLTWKELNILRMTFVTILYNVGKYFTSNGRCLNLCFLFIVMNILIIWMEYSQTCKMKYRYKTCDQYMYQVKCSRLFFLLLLLFCFIGWTCDNFISTSSITKVKFDIQIFISCLFLAWRGMVRL